MKHIHKLTLILSSICLFLISCKGEDTLENKFESFSDTRDGNVYKTIKIGNQTWMAENLKYLPAISNNSTVSLATPLYYVYSYSGTDVIVAKNGINYTTYGVLYNWEAAKNACPTGWHLPSSSEWNQLISYLGGANVAGIKLKSTTLWSNPYEGTSNDSKFTALPAGYLNENKKFSVLGEAAYFWTSTVNGSTAYAYGMFNYDGKTNGGYISKQIGMSVRCIKD